MTEQIYATFRGVRVRVLSATEGAAHVQALKGEPFEFRGSKVPYHLGHTAFWSCKREELSDVRIIDIEYENQKIADWLDDQKMYQQLRNGG